MENQVNIKMIRYTKALKLISENVIKSKTLGAAYGNSFLGALSLGHVERKEIDNWNETKRVIKAEINPIYLKQYKLFKALYQSTSGLMQ